MSSNKEEQCQVTSSCDVSGKEIKSEECNDGVGVASSTNSEGENKIELFDASKMGFNDRAWNDPPPLLMSSTTTNTGTPTGRKLNSRVAFPLDSAAYPAPDSNARVPLDPNAPPPMGGFINADKQIKPLLPPPFQP